MSDGEGIEKGIDERNERIRRLEEELNRIKNGTVKETRGTDKQQPESNPSNIKKQQPQKHRISQAGVRGTTIQQQDFARPNPRKAKARQTQTKKTKPVNKRN